MKLLALGILTLSLAAFGDTKGGHADTAHAQVTPPAFKWGQTFSYQIRMPGVARNTPPFVRVFPDGKDASGKDMTATLDTLKWARGKSQLYPAEDAAPGLIAVLRGVSFVADADGRGYSAIFEGEFNAIKIRVDKAQMEALLTGRPTELAFVSRTEKGVGVKYRVETVTRLSVRLEGTRMMVDKVGSSCTVTYINIFGSETPYRSKDVSIEKEKGRDSLYLGIPGALKGLPVL